MDMMVKMKNQTTRTASVSCIHPLYSGVLFNIINLYISYFTYQKKKKKKELLVSHAIRKHVVDSLPARTALRKLTYAIGLHKKVIRRSLTLKVSSIKRESSLTLNKMN